MSKLMYSVMESSLKEAASLLTAMLNDPKLMGDLDVALHVLIESLRVGGCIYSCGNGGSMSDAMHFAEEMTGRFREDRKALRAIAISDPSYLSCVANDYGYEFVFSRFVEAHVSGKDVLLAISTSGNSLNVVNAAKAAKKAGAKVVALTGKNDCKLKEFSDVLIAVPSGKYADRVQELHIKIIHAWIESIEKNIS